MKTQVQHSHVLLESRRLNLSGLVSSEFPFAEAPRAYEASPSEPGQYWKVALTY